MRIGDKPIAFSIRTSLALAWLETGNTGAAQPLLDAVVLERPERTEVRKLQARMAWEKGDVAAAAERMGVGVSTLYRRMRILDIG